jgi:hypothetical protein
VLSGRGLESTGGPDDLEEIAAFDGGRIAVL